MNGALDVELNAIAIHRRVPHGRSMTSGGDSSRVRLDDSLG